jgi:hypothetical protein
MLQGSKCLKDICRPIAVPDGDTGNMKVLQPISSEPKDSCCVWTIQAQDTDGHGEEKCFLGRVCETEEAPVEVRSSYHLLLHAAVQPLTVVHAERLHEPIGISKPRLAGNVYRCY